MEGSREPLPPVVLVALAAVADITSPVISSLPILARPKLSMLVLVGLLELSALVTAWTVARAVTRPSRGLRPSVAVVEKEAPISIVLALVAVAPMVLVALAWLLLALSAALRRLLPRLTASPARVPVVPLAA